MWAPSHPLPDNLRRVGALHLRVTDADSIGRARIAIEDGLACADFNDCGRLVYVRRLALPAFSGQFNGPAAARAIEATFRAMLPEAVHGSEPHAASAPMVWFADLLEARIQALSRRVHGEALTAWFWRNVDRSFAWNPEPAIAEVFAVIERMNEGVITPAIAMKALAQRWRRFRMDGFEKFLRALPPPPEVRTVPRGLTAVEAATHIYKSGPAIRVLAAQAGARLEIAARLAPARAAWLARWELVASDVMPADGAAAEVSLVSELLDMAVPRSTSNKAAARVIGRETCAPDVIAPSRHSAQVPGHTTTPVPTLVPERELPPWLAHVRATPHGGFFLLMNAWRAAGIDAWLEEAAPLERDAWLEHWAQRLALADDDCQRDAWRVPTAVLPAHLAENFARLTRSTRRWLRTAARIGPASVVRRNAAVAITRTHIDVVFPMNAVDLRIRRVGLDQDPGWVPWLGRIVAFHYVESRDAS